MDQSLLAGWLGPAGLVLQDDLRSGIAVPAEVNDMRLVLEEGLEQVVGADGPTGDQFDGIPILSRADLGRDLADFLVEMHGFRGGGVGGQEEDLDLAHSVSCGRARSQRFLGCESS